MPLAVPAACVSAVASLRRNVADRDDDSPTLRRFLVHLAAERGLALNTLLAYAQDVRAALAHLSDHGTDALHATADDWRAFLRDQSAGGRATRTVARRLAAVRLLLKWLATAEGHDHVLHVLEHLDRPKPEQSLPHVLSRSQIATLLDAVRQDDSPLGVRDAAILELLYASGLRASELCGVRVADAHLDAGWVRVLGKGDKERIVPLGRPAADAVGAYLIDVRSTLLRRPVDVLFLSRTGKPLERVALWQIVRRRAAAAGMGGRVWTHVLRHCFASHLVSGGADLRSVQTLLGHADVATTQIYTHVDTDRLKDVHARYHPRG